MADRTQPISLDLLAARTGLAGSLSLALIDMSGSAVSGASFAGLSEYDATDAPGCYTVRVTHPDTFTGGYVVVTHAASDLHRRFAIGPAALLPTDVEADEVAVHVMPLTAQATASAFTSSDRVPLRFVRGERKTITIRCLDSAGESVDLSGKSLRFLIKNQHGTGIIEVESGANLTITGDANDTAAITVELAANIAELKGSHELWNLTDSVRLCHGPVVLEGALKDVP